MQILTRASEELFSRSADERFENLVDLVRNCQAQKQESQDRWLLPAAVKPEPADLALQLKLGQEGCFKLNDWGFSQLCRLAGVAKETVNRLSADTAAKVLGETLPGGNKPLQIFARADHVRSIHGAAYTSLFNADLLTGVQEFA